MSEIDRLASSAELIVQGYAFIPRNGGITVVNLHKLDQMSFIFNDEIVETTVDDIEAYKIQKIYNENKKYLGEEHA